MQKLILVPTEMELSLAPELNLLAGAEVTVALCGFGPIAAAARSSQLLAQLQPCKVLLVGIAGSLDPRLNGGKAYVFRQVLCHGIGVGSGTGFRSASSLGWEHWPDEPRISDCLRLHVPEDQTSCAEQLLTVCAASADLEEARSRRRLYPLAEAEDMEGFAVAAACRLHSVRLTVIRGISNLAGDREHGGWLSAEAMRSAAELARQVIGV